MWEEKSKSNSNKLGCIRINICHDPLASPGFGSCVFLCCLPAVCFLSLFFPALHYSRSLLSSGVFVEFVGGFFSWLLSFLLSSFCRPSSRFLIFIWISLAALYGSSLRSLFRFSTSGSLYSPCVLPRDPLLRVPPLCLASRLTVPLTGSIVFFRHGASP